MMNDWYTASTASRLTSGGTGRNLKFSSGRWKEISIIFLALLLLEMDSVWVGSLEATWPVQEHSKIQLQKPSAETLNDENFYSEFDLWFHWKRDGTHDTYRSAENKETNEASKSIYKWLGIIYQILWTQRFLTWKFQISFSTKNKRKMNEEPSG